jgi:hypothetical protein
MSIKVGRLSAMSGIQTLADEASLAGTCGDDVCGSFYALDERKCHAGEHHYGGGDNQEPHETALA